VNVPLSRFFVLVGLADIHHLKLTWLSGKRRKIRLLWGWSSGNVEFSARVSYWSSDGSLEERVEVAPADGAKGLIGFEV
jgi:hypothetical protein